MSMPACAPDLDVALSAGRVQDSPTIVVGVIDVSTLPQEKPHLHIVMYILLLSLRRELVCKKEKEKMCVNACNMGIRKEK